MSLSSLSFSRSYGKLIRSIILPHCKFFVTTLTKQFKLIFKNSDTLYILVFSSPNLYLSMLIWLCINQILATLLLTIPQRRYIFQAPFDIDLLLKLKFNTGPSTDPSVFNLVCLLALQFALIGTALNNHAIFPANVTFFVSEEKKNGTPSNYLYRN